MKVEDIQAKHLKETLEQTVNEQGEPDLDYVIWLEDNLCKSIEENKELIEENERLNNPEKTANIGNLFKIFITKLDSDSVLYTITDETGDLIRNYGKIDLFLTGLKKLLKTNKK